MAQAALTQNSGLNPAVSEFLKRAGKMMINNRWSASASGKTFDTVDPSTAKVIAQIAEGDKADIDKAVTAARGAFENPVWRDMAPMIREQLIHKFADKIEQHIEELAQISALDDGKSIHISPIEVALTVQAFRYFAGWPSKLTSEVMPNNLHAIFPGKKFFSYSLKEPVGVVGLIVPWNFPLLLLAWKLAPALATGCTCVIKPSENAPLTALRLGELAIEAGFPAGVINIVPGFGETAGRALTHHQGVDKIAFTGSTEVGKEIVQAASGNLKRVTLELGGKSPCIVFDDANLSEAALATAANVFFHQGQFCAAPTRLYVQKKSFDKVISEVCAYAKSLTIGPTLDPKNTFGPLVSEEQLKRVQAYVKTGVAEGAKVLTGGNAIKGPGYFFEPTVLVNTTNKMRVVQEEIFGPVLTAMPFETMEDVIRDANDSFYGLAAGVFTSDIKRAHDMAAALGAGQIWINYWNAFDSAIPFGGYRESGWGKELGAQGIDAYLKSKSVIISH